ncbi:MAG TPA: tRNA (guanosine(37)-N1)-methyltransferase TrmD [Nocardioidaceae bacterium]|nr:tRNA (guanosine(37)-N1)-methyltransferase TrmD [Nocardioidaceae bacterium]
MRIDVVSIFPDYLAPLGLSLVGKAQTSGLLDIHVHDLRTWTRDRHHTIDDTPYGGGAGMVMKPEPWGEALDEIITLSGDTAAPQASADPAPGPVLVVTTPSGAPLTQPLAQQLAARSWLVVACGRYEGIDQRVIDHARTRMEVREVSIGDYVVSGGEVAALVLIEAVVRLLPGFMGNPDSLAEESHVRSALLEYPVYTKPPTWRGHEVPAVLLSGNHAKIADWRQEQARRRTAERRPDLLHPSQQVAPDNLGREAVIAPAELADAPEIWTLQRACWLQVAQTNVTLDLTPLTETLDDVRLSLRQWRTYVIRTHGRLVGSVRARLAEERWEIGRIMVAPDLQGRGLGRCLLDFAEELAPEEARSFAVLADSGGDENTRWYRKAGYRRAGPAGEPGALRFVKGRR